MWIARDKDDNKLHIFNKKPTRQVEEYVVDNEYYVYWLLNSTTDDMNQIHGFEIDSKLFPELSWNDEPIEVELTIKQK